MTTLNIHNETNINVKGIHTRTNAKPVICIDTGEVFASMTDAAEHIGVRPHSVSEHIKGRCKTINGKRFCLLSKATENLDILTSQITKLNADAEDARKWREYQAEQEAIRKAEEERIRAEQERIAAIERARQEREERKRKLEEKMARRQRIIERLSAELQRAMERYDEAANEYNALCEEDREVNVA
jgi:chromosome segregation ATPase